jgi:hypothetical protein
MRNRIILAMLAAILSLPAFSQIPIKEVRYRASEEDFINPERGFMSQYSHPREKLEPALLAALRAKNQSVIWRMYQVQNFRDRPFSQEYLASVREDFNAVRAAGMKILPRWSYCSRIGDDDAPIDLVLTHINQLAPILKENADIIVAMNCGFIGAWGEMHSSTHGLTEPENMRKLIFALLDILPPERCVQVRYPRSKYAVFNRRTPITLDHAFDGSRISRVAHHNDCFLASPTDVGTYTEDIDNEKAFLHEETKYTPMGGETCNPRAGYPIYYSKTIREMEMMHWSFLNSLYSRRIIDQWVTDGYYDEIARRLGYRLELVSGSYQTEAAAGSNFSFSLTVRNTGFASPFNPRLVELVLVHAKKGTSYKVILPPDPRFWFAGETHDFAYAPGLPADMEPGEYKVYLNLPDPMERLYTRPEYSIRLANEGIAFTKEGYNDLGWTLKVTDDAAPAHHSFLRFSKF